MAMPWNRNRNTSRRAVLKASAFKKQIGTKATVPVVKRQGWQEEAFEAFDDLGIVKAPVWWSGNALSKLKLFAAVRPLDDPEGSPIPVTDPQSGIPSNLATYAQAEIERLKSPMGGRSEIIRMLQMNLELTGMGWLICRGATSTVTDDPLVQGGKLEILTPESWDIRSVREVEEKGEGPTAQTIIHSRPGDKGVSLDPTKDEAIVIFQRNPGWSGLADCHMRGLLTDCNSLVLLQNEVQAESKARQSNGLLLLPNELGTGPYVDTEGEDGDEASNDPLMDDIANAMIEPIEDPSAASSVVPTFLRGPADALKEVRHIQFHRETTQVLEQRIEARKVGIAEGMNLPPEVVRGHMGTTFANAITIDQDTFDDYLLPRVGLITDGLTVAFLQPHLLDAGFPPDLVDRVLVAGDPSDMIKQADPAEFADEGVTLNTISDEAWRRYRGFTEDDAPEPLQQLLRSIFHQRTWDPGLTDAVVKDVIPELDIPAPPGEVAPAASGVPTAIAASARKPELIEALQAVVALARQHDAPKLEARASGALAKRDPGRALAQIDTDLRTKILVASNAAMIRALEKAGNRLKAKAGAHKAALKTINPVYAAEHLGPSLVASAGFVDTDLITDDSFDGAVQQFDQWTAHAQEKALVVAAGVVAFSGSEKEHIRAQQRAARADAGVWLKAALLGLAVHKLYAPDEIPVAGEFDPSLRIPAGLVREAMAIAGGAQGIEQKAPDTFVATVNGEPVGGIGNGTTITAAMTDGGALIQGMEWDYGPAERKNPFEPHEELDGVIFTSFGDEVLSTDAAESWLGITGTSRFPGDHAGCLCEFVLVWVPPSEITGDTADLASDEGVD